MTNKFLIGICIAFCLTLQNIFLQIVSLPDDRTDSYIKQLRSILDPSVQMVMTLVPQQKSDRYAGGHP